MASAVLATISELTDINDFRQLSIIKPAIIVFSDHYSITMAATTRDCVDRNLLIVLYFVLPGFVYQYSKIACQLKSLAVIQ